MRGFLDLRRLRYFKTIADHGSLSAAARSLNLAQPALSHHITQLENQIGLPLLQRRHDGVTLTETGKVLLRHALDIHARVEEAEAELACLARAPERKVKIRLAIISSLAADLTPILVETLAKEMPEVVLRITEAGTLDSRELLDRGKADLAIYLAAQHGSELPLALEQLYLVTAGEPPQTAQPIPFAEVAMQRLVMPAADNPLRSLVESAAQRAGYTLDVALEVDGSDPRRKAVLAGLGGTIFGAHAVQDPLRMAGLVVRPIVEPPLFRPIFFGMRRGLDAALTAKIRAVLEKSLAEFGCLIVGRSKRAADT